MPAKGKITANLKHSQGLKAVATVSFFDGSVLMLHETDDGERRFWIPPTTEANLLISRMNGNGVLTTRDEALIAGMNKALDDVLAEAESETEETEEGEERSDEE